MRVFRALRSRRSAACQSSSGQASVRTRGGLTSKRRPSRLSGLVRSFRRQCESRSAAFCVGVEGRRLGGVTLECREPLTPCALPAANSPAFSVDSCTALILGSSNGWFYSVGREAEGWRRWPSRPPAREPRRRFLAPRADTEGWRPSGAPWR